MVNKNEKDGQRYYEIDGIEYPSVTTIIEIISKGFWYYLWLKKHTADESTQISEEASDIGKRIHEHINFHAKAKIEGNIDYKPVLLEDEVLPFTAFLKWEKSNNVQYMRTELFVFSKKYAYAGTTDLICLVNEVPTLVDIKTSKRFYDTMGLQLSAYKAAFLEQNPKEVIEKTAILRLDKVTGKPYYKEYGNDFDVFLKAKDIFNWRNKRKGGK